MTIDPSINNAYTPVYEGGVELQKASAKVEEALNIADQWRNERDEGGALCNREMLPVWQAPALEKCQSREEEGQGKPSIEHLWLEDPKEQRHMEQEAKLHCPNEIPPVHCGPHGRIRMNGIVSTQECDTLYELWKWYQDDLRWPWYKKKPEFRQNDFDVYRDVCSRVVKRIGEAYGRELVLDQATISNTNHIGHPPHADNVQFDSVWWQGKRIREKDQLAAARDGAYSAWRIEKTSYRNYSCTVSLVPSDWYGGGELQFFSSWGDRDPIASYKNEQGDGIAFCGCQRNIHAVTGVKWGFRLVLLIWTRPPGVFVPIEQTSTCYFRPGTGYSVWLTTADLRRKEKESKRRRLREELENTDKSGDSKENAGNNAQGNDKYGNSKEEKSDGGYGEKSDDEQDDDEEITCNCSVCGPERPKKSWKYCMKIAEANSDKNGEMKSCVECTPSPQVHGNSDTTECYQCPGPHERMDLNNVLGKAEVARLTEIWRWYRDDLSHPWYEQKPDFDAQDFWDFYGIAQMLVDSMASKFGIPFVLDQATISATNHTGLPPHCDNVQLDSVWWRNIQLKKQDELVAVRNGGKIRWKKTKTSYRSHSATIALTDPEAYTGGDLEFYERWGDTEASQTYRCPVGDGVAYCGCESNIHAVTGVDWGCRLSISVWVRPPGVDCPKGQESVCYFRPGTGQAVWLTTAEIRHAASKGEPQGQWCKGWNEKGQGDESGT